MPVIGLAISFSSDVFVHGFVTTILTLVSPSGIYIRYRGDLEEPYV